MVNIAALGIAALACATDLRSARIPNWLTLGAMVAGLCFHAMLPGSGGIGAAALGLLVGLLVFFPFFALGALGAGDVKLMAALGAWIGAAAVVNVALYGAVAGGVLAVIVAVSRNYLPRALAQPAHALHALVAGRNQAAARTHARQRPGTATAVCAPDHGRTGGGAVAKLMLRRLARTEQGAELIEMAIVTPLLLLLVMGIVDFGFLFQRYVVLTNAAVEGARVATLPGYTTADAQARVQAYASDGGVRGLVTRCRRGRVAAGCRRRYLARHAGDRHPRLHAAVHRTDRDARRREHGGQHHVDRTRHDAIAGGRRILNDSETP